MTPTTELTDYQREQQARSEKQRALSTAVAAHLPGWQLGKRPDIDGRAYGSTWFLIDQDGRKIELEQDRYHIPTGKVHISGYWPQRANGPFMSPSDVNETSPSINVSATRGAEVIASEIKRRFLPEYVRIWDKLHAKATAELNTKTAMESAWQGLLAYAPSVLEEGRHKHDIDRNEPRGRLNFKGFGEVRMIDPDYLTLDIHGVTVAQAREILAVLARKA